MDAVELRLALFDGSPELETLIRRELLRATAHLPADDPIRGKVEVFIGDIALLGLSAQISGEWNHRDTGRLIDTWRELRMAL